MADNSDLELDLQGLEGISGGNIGKTERSAMITVIEALKTRHIPKEIVISTIQKFTVPGSTIENVTPDEVALFVDACWDKI